MSEPLPTILSSPDSEPASDEGQILQRFTAANFHGLSERTAGPDSGSRKHHQLNSISRSWALTVSPGFTCTDFTVASRSDLICDSIFIASSDTRGSPLFTG